MLYYGIVRVKSNLGRTGFAKSFYPLLAAPKASGDLWPFKGAFVRLGSSSHHSADVEFLQTLKALNNHESVESERSHPQKSHPYNTRRRVKLVREEPALPFWTPDGYMIVGKRGKLRPLETTDQLRNLKMKATVQILTTPTVDTPGTTVMLQCDDQRYLFGNLSEGSQRVAIENDWKLSKITDIFLSGRTEWKSIGGLLGTTLTLAESLQAAEAEKINQAKKLNAAVRSFSAVDRGHAAQSPEKQRLSLYGGPNLTQMLATARKFIFRKGVPLDVQELAEPPPTSSSQPTFSNKHIQVWAMGVKPVPLKQSPSWSPAQSPRKRSFDEFREDSGSKGPLGDKKTDHNQGLQICKAVVSNMFESNWRYDALVEIPLSEAHLHFNGPAKVFVRNPTTHKIERLALPEQSSTEPGLPPDMKVLVRKPWPATLVSELPHTTPSTTAMSYFVRCQLQRGKFEVHKAKALNIPPGPLYTKLTNGESIELESGQIVHSKDVLGAEIPGNGFAVIDVPSSLYVKDLTGKVEWKNAEIMDGLRAIIWNLGPSVGENEEFRAFLASLKTMYKVDHLISSPDYSTNNLGFRSAAISTNRLHRIDNVRFIDLIHGNSRRRHLDPEKAKVARRGCTINLHPASSLDEQAALPDLDVSALVNDIPPEAKALAKTIHHECQSKEFQMKFQNQGLPSPEAEIICLGTGSAHPSKYRNLSGTLLRVPGYGSYLLDCGENTLGQLRRIYTEDELAEVLRDLKMVWISHLHADHHLGIVSVIKAWHRAVHGSAFISLDEHHANIENQPVDPLMALREVKRLFVASDVAMNQWLAEYAHIEDYGYDKLVTLDVKCKLVGQSYHTYLTWGDHNMSFEGSNREIGHAIRAATGLSLLQTANVDHCHGAKAVSLTFPNGFKFSFSGDCRPCPEFVRIGKGSTVLVHEATFDDELQGDALAKKHSTISEAIGVGTAMGARRILLTHFSQRYQKIPTMSSIEGKIEELVKKTDDQLMEQNEVQVSGKTLNESGTESLARGTASTMGENAPLSPLIRKVSISSDSFATSDVPNINSSDTSQPLQRSVDIKVAVAFDYMRVKVKDIMVLEKLMSPITALFEHFEKEKGEKKEHNKAIMSDREKHKAEKRAKVMEAQTGEAKRKNSKESLRGNNFRRLKGGKGGDEGAIGVEDTIPNRARSEEAKPPAVSETKKPEEMQPSVNGADQDFDAVASKSESVKSGNEAAKPLQATG